MKQATPITKYRWQQGFTMVELMIATSIFSTILLLISVGVISLTRDYYKGLNSSATQTTTATVMNDISQTLQLSGDSITQATGHDHTNFQMYCVGTSAFAYIPGLMLHSGDTAPDNIGVYQIQRSKLASNDCNQTSADAVASDPKSFSGQELLAPNMRVTKFSISDVASGCLNGGSANSAVLCKISLTIAYGDGPDLFCDASIGSAGDTGNCLPDSPPLTDAVLTDQVQNHSGTADIRCRSSTGSQFCAVSALNTVVQRRL